MNKVYIKFPRLIISLKIALFSLLFVSTFRYLNYIMPNLETKDARNFIYLDQNSLDVAFFGSSRIQYSVSPTLIHAYSNLYSYNYGSQCQPLDMTNAMIKEVFKTQKPKVVALDIYTATSASQVCRDDSNYVIGQALLSGLEKQTILERLPKDKALSYRQAFLNNHHNWKNFKDLSDFYNPKHLKDKNVPLNFGYIFQPNKPFNNMWINEWHEKDSSFHLNRSVIDQLDQILKTTLENGAQLMLFFVPADDYKLESSNEKNAIWDWAKQNKVLYLDFLDPKLNFGFYSQVHHDGYHSYLNGANIISYNLSNFLKKNYTFNHIQTSKLDSEFKTYFNEYALAVLQTELNPYYYLPLIQYSDLVLLKYNGTNQSRLVDYECAVLKKLGANFDFCLNKTQNYYGLIKDGQLISNADTQLRYQLEDKEILINPQGIFINNQKLDFSNYPLFNKTNLEGDFSLVVFFGNQYVVKNIDYTNAFWERGFKEGLYK